MWLYLHGINIVWSHLKLNKAKLIATYSISSENRFILYCTPIPSKAICQPVQRRVVAIRSHRFSRIAKKAARYAKERKYHTSRENFDPRSYQIRFSGKVTHLKIQFRMFDIVSQRRW